MIFTRDFSVSCSFVDALHLDEASSPAEKSLC
jgi:hypothetical protein